MGKWIERSESEGLWTALRRRESQRVEKAAHEAFCNERVDEERVQAFLKPFEEPMKSVQDDLETQGYTVTHIGYGYNPIFAPDLDSFALVREDPPQAYGQAWTIDAPDGQRLDTLRLFPLVSRDVFKMTHFYAGGYSLLDGGGRIVEPDCDREIAIAKLQNLIGARIESYYAGSG